MLSDVSLTGLDQGAHGNPDWTDRDSVADGRGRSDPISALQSLVDHLERAVARRSARNVLQA